MPRLHSGGDIRVGIGINHVAYCSWALRATFQISLHDQAQPVLYHNFRKFQVHYNP